MQHAGQQLRATTSKLGQRLQQQIMKGNAAEQQSWQQALEPSAAADEKAGRNAVPDSGEWCLTWKCRLSVYQLLTACHTLSCMLLPLTHTLVNTVHAAVL